VKLNADSYPTICDRCGKPVLAKHTVAYLFDHRTGVASSTHVDCDDPSLLSRG
jgi:hypothetical protein